MRIVRVIVGAREPHPFKGSRTISVEADLEGGDVLETVIDTLKSKIDKELDTWISEVITKTENLEAF